MGNQSLLEEVPLSISSDNSPDWIYRILDKRVISIKTKNEQVRKIAAIDSQTNLPFGIDVPNDMPLKNVEINKSYFASLKVYTTSKVTGVSPEYVEFFKVLNVNQPIEDFIKAYWLYPKLIKFELVETEPLN